MMNRYTRYLPRWLNRRFAQLFGFYWMPCYRCGQHHGGHEFEYPDYPIPVTFDKRTFVNCPWCRVEGFCYSEQGE